MRNEEKEILKKYLKGRCIEKGDRPSLDRWANVGYVKYGYSFRHNRETARTTDRAKRMIKREEIKKNPIKRFFYNYSTYLF